MSIFYLEADIRLITSHIHGSLSGMKNGLRVSIVRIGESEGGVA